MSDKANVSALERLEIIAACTRLTSDYSWSNDSDRATSGMQFADDAEMHLWGDVYKGRAAIREFMGRREANVQTMHAVTNVRIDVESATTARGTAYVLAMMGVRAADGKPPRMTRTIRGIYRDRFRKVGEDWFIAERSFEDIFAQDVTPA